MSKEWIAIRGECVSGGELNDSCNLVAAAHGADIVIVQQVLACGCILVPEELEEVIL